MLISAIKTRFDCNFGLLRRVDFKQHQFISLRYFIKETQDEFDLRQKLECHIRNAQERCRKFYSHV